MLVDDEESILQFLELGLSNEGAIVQTAVNGKAALELVQHFKPHIVILDLELSPTEYELLKLLLSHHGAVLSKTLILDKVWGYDFGGEQNIVEVYIRSLREKLGDKEHRVIRTIRGAGYRMDLL